MAASGSSDASCASGSERLSPPRISPPKAVVDVSPLQQAMDRNKESLKMKLMMRRPITQLVAQGIMPPLKTPPAYHEQRIQLERAKTGDVLKAKIQKRPDRQELERRHILESQEGHVDPSLAEKQRMLKKARLADQLNVQLSHRPGPLELIKKNILHTEEPVEDAVKRDLVAFRATSEGTSHRPSQPSAYFLPPDEHSPSPSPPSTLSPASVASPPLHHPAPGKDKNRKSKSKLKQVPKTRQIKFHEYKGPPSAQKTLSGGAASAETPYELLLQQQQLLLQLTRTAAAQHSPAASPATSESSDVYAPPPPPPPPPPQPARIEEMKVSELRAACKLHNLRVSGPKPQLIDRLRPYLGADDSPRSPASVCSPDPRDSAEREPLPAEEAPAPHSQRADIEELQRELEAVLREAASVAAAGDQQQSKRLLQAKIYVSRLRAQLEALQQTPPPPPPPPPPAQPAQPARYILAAPTEPSPDRIVRLIAMTPPSNADSNSLDSVKTNATQYILNGVKVVPIAILPSHYEPQQIRASLQVPLRTTMHQVQAQPVQTQPLQATIQTQPVRATIQTVQSPPSVHEVDVGSPAPDASLADDMDDVLEILVENGELPRSAVSVDREIDSILSEPFSPGEVLGTRDMHTATRLQGDELQRELDEIQNEILQHADSCNEVVDLLSNDGFATDFGGQNGDAHDVLGSFLRGESEPMDVNECSRHSAMDAFDVGELDFPPLHHDFDSFQDFELDTDAMQPPPQRCDLMEMDVIPNVFGRGHQPQHDPLLGGVLSRPPPRPAHILYSWDKIDLDPT